MKGFLILVLLLTGCTGSSPAATTSARSTLPPTPPATATVLRIPDLATPVVLAPAAPAPPPIPTITLAPSAAPPSSLTVAGTGPDGLNVRQSPGAAIVANVPDGTKVTDTGERQDQGGRSWKKIRLGDGREGWAATEFLIAEGQAQPQAAKPAAPQAKPTIPPAAVSKPAQKPAGATGQCRDGSYTDSRNRQGACSSHGGIAVWFGP